MKKRKNFGKKIKRTKNLYRKRKTRGQKIAGTILLIAAAAAIAFLGFFIGKPLLDYLGGVKSEPAPEWSPQTALSETAVSTATAVSSDTAVQTSETEPPVIEANANLTVSSETAAITTKTPEIVSETTAVTTAPETTTETTTTTEPPKQLIKPAFYVSAELPTGSLANRAALSAALAKAASNGYNSAVITLKDLNGNLHYDSDLWYTDTLVKDDMTLGDIVSAFIENDMAPIVKLSVLSDNAGCLVFSDINYKCYADNITWLDISTGVNLLWARPDSSETRAYLDRIINELSEAGIEKIMLNGLIYPTFQFYDHDYILDKYFADDRYKMLFDVIPAGTIIEVSAKDALSEPLGRTAEMLADPSMFNSNSIALIINRDDFSVDDGYPADAKSLVETVISLVNQRVGSVPIIPVIESSSFGDTDTAKIAEQLIKLGYSNYIMR